MKHFVRTVAVVLFCAMTLCLLCSCHGRLVREGEQTKKDVVLFDVPDTFDTSRTIEITFWAKNDTNIKQTNIYKKAIADFEALYPNIKIKYKAYTDYSRMYSDVITNIPTNTTPNVCITYPDHVATYITGADTVVPLDTLLTDEKYGLGGSEVLFDSPKKDEIVSEYLNEGYIDGVSYALPFMRSTEACYINKTFVEKLGYTLPETLTWDFVWEVSEKALEKNADGTYKVNGQKVMIPFIYKSTDNMMIQMARQNDVPFSESNGKILLFNDKTKDILNSIEPHARTGAFNTFKIISYPANFLNAGQCIFAVDSTAGATWMGSNAPLLDISKDSLVPFETAVMTVPQTGVGDPVMISQGPSVCLFNKEDPQEVLASWLFMQYLLTDGVQIAYAETEGYIPVTYTGHASSDYWDYLAREGEDNDVHYDVKIKAAKLLLDNVSNTFVTPVFNGSASLREASGQLIERVTLSAQRNETVDDAYYKALYERMISQYHLTLDPTEKTGQ